MTDCCLQCQCDRCLGYDRTAPAAVEQPAQGTAASPVSTVNDQGACVDWRLEKAAALRSTARELQQEALRIHRKARYYEMCIGRRERSSMHDWELSEILSRDSKTHVNRLLEMSAAELDALERTLAS